MRSGDHKLASSFLNRKRWSVADRGGERFNPALAGCCPPTPTPRYLLHLHLHLHLWPRTNPSIDRTHFSLPVPALPSIPLSRQPSSLHSFVPLSFSSLSIINPSIASSNPHLKYLSISTSTYRLRIRQHHHHHHRHHLWRRTFRHTNTSSQNPRRTRLATQFLPRRDLSPVAIQAICHHYTTTTLIDDNSNTTNELYISNHFHHTLNPTPTLASQTISTIGL